MKPSKPKSRSPLLLVSILVLLAIFYHTTTNTTTTHSKKSLPQCPSPLPKQATPPAPINLWAPLSIPETLSIHSWLHSPSPNLNLTHASSSVPSDNTIFLIESLPPLKSDALAYLSAPDTTPLPERRARVTIHHGAPSAGGAPFVGDYILGPLPISPTTTIKKLEGVYHRDPIPYDARGFGSLKDFEEFLGTAVERRLVDAIEVLLNGTIRGSPGSDTLVVGPSAPFGYDGSFRRMWLTWRRNLAGAQVHPMGLYVYIDVSGTDPSLSKVLKVVYDNHHFSSSSEFIEAVYNHTLTPLPYPPPPQNKDSWSRRTRRPHKRDLDHLPGPRSVSFAGARFRVDRATNYVGWMDWGMYLSFDRDMGLSIWDVRMKGERIIYQMAPQEALAQYAGDDPIQPSTAWLDRFFGMGALSRSLMPHYDCPTEAVYLPAQTYAAGKVVVQDKAICVFEMDSGRPLTRHYGDEDGEFGAVKGYTLTVRSISTVGKCFDYIFHLDGTIEVRLSASGYLQATYWDPSQSQSNYGTRIRDTTMGSLHDHIVNYKIDFDIAGTRNTLLRTTTFQEEVEQPWFLEDWGEKVVQQRIKREYITNESEALLVYPDNYQGGYAVVNLEEKNRWGNPRGYAVVPGYSAVRNTVVGSKRLLDNANWARYNLAVSLRKETEPSSSSMWNLHLPGAPVVDFHRFFDGEGIRQEDVVAWVNLGMHHLPQAEDSPNTKTNVATSSFVLTPHNYFDEDVSMDSQNAIVLSRTDTDSSGKYEYEDYGVKLDYHCMPHKPGAFEYTDPAEFSHPNVK